MRGAVHRLIGAVSIYFSLTDRGSLLLSAASIASATNSSITPATLL